MFFPIRNKKSSDQMHCLELVFNKTHIAIRQGEQTKETNLLSLGLKEASFQKVLSSIGKSELLCLKYKLLS